MLPRLPHVDPPGGLYCLAAPSLPTEVAKPIEGVELAKAVVSTGAMPGGEWPVLVSNIADDEPWAGLNAVGTFAGFQSCWLSPITGELGEFIGVLALYSPEPRAPSDDETACITASRELCEIALRRHHHSDERTRQADIDALTGLPNRAAFDRALARQRCDLSGTWALFVLDLDNLKTVNDVFGHKAGDDLIRAAGTRIAQAMAPDATFRIGGDEFVVIIEQADALRDLERAAHRIFAALDASAVCDGQAVVPTATVGGAVFDAADAGVASVYQNADFALYHAKETGRGGFVRYWPGIGSRMIRRRSVVRDVATALEEQRIEAYYQPVLRLDTHEIVSVEALCRMRTPSGAIVSARTFKDATMDAKVADVAPPG